MRSCEATLDQVSKLVLPHACKAFKLTNAKKNRNDPNKEDLLQSTELINTIKLDV